MYKSIRKRRRDRHKIKAQLRALDEQALTRIRKSFSWSMETWGGTRCGGCGIPVRPHWLCNLSSFVTDDQGRVVGHITAFGWACDYIKNCPGEREWM